VARWRCFLRFLISARSLLIPLLSLAWFGASTIGVLEAQQLIAMTIFQAVLFGILGWPVYRRLMAPLLYLYFLVPFGEFLVPTLQDFTARFAVLGLRMLGIPVFSDGILIDVTSRQFCGCRGVRRFALPRCGRRLRRILCNGDL